MGMPMYGQTFSLASGKNNGLNVPTYGGGEAGEATRSRGFLSYYEVNIFDNMIKLNTKNVFSTFIKHFHLFFLRFVTRC